MPPFYEQVYRANHRLSNALSEALKGRRHDGNPDVNAAIAVVLSNDPPNYPQDPLYADQEWVQSNRGSVVDIRR